MHADQYTLTSLEFNRIVDEVRKHCYCSGGKAYTDKMKPLTDSLRIEERLQESLEMKELISFEEMIPLETVEKIEDLLEKINVVGSILDPLQLKRLADYQAIIKALWQYKKDKEEKYPHIVRYLKQLDPLEDLIFGFSELLIKRVRSKTVLLINYVVSEMIKYLLAQKF